VAAKLSAAQIVGAGPWCGIDAQAPSNSEPPSASTGRKREW
jgi:hypothetical protein